MPKSALRTPAPPRGRLALLLGPAFVAAIAYVDPGNVAANVTAGARYGYLLVWVLLVANAVAVIVQYQSAKLGLVTGSSLPELLGRRLRRWPRRAFWLQAELVAAATDLAEVLGGAIALHLLFGLHLLLGGVIIGLASMALLVVQTHRGQRSFEVVIVTLLAVILVGFVSGLLVSPVDGAEFAAGILPRFDGTDSVLLASSMLGATVMPHVIYLHSALVRDRHGGGLAPGRIRTLIRATRWDVALALVIAGAINLSMLVLAASSLRGAAGTDTIEGAHAIIADALGPVIAAAFAIGLLASGLASTSVGTYAGSVVMGGLLRVRVPLLARRVVTLIPALVILGLGIDPTLALVVSQVALSFGIPFALVPLISLAGSRRVMGSFVTSVPLRAVSWVATAGIIAINVVLIVLTFAG
ncbi:Nramp family divalent metal transporter [Galbitalea sp. SE-J8]|uniref:Nramp family divalent metal transporter n=1 Tax=Galbitalea sp. SE-J8 TaxID=3054952 RepID=UPI00259C9192|nr:Nramp family divalent metal transporter [Galbitalea sp. SE-J8]MDM4763557.1 Nramp family divalent metal transporter [Galbitalea sp. SE-J8]